MFNKKKLTALGILIVLFLAACTLQEPKITKTTVSSNTKMLFSRFMALGDNIISGYQNAALTKKHQQYSFPALIASQGQTPNFQQPLLGYPGLGSESYGGYGTLELRYLDNPKTPNTINPDPLIYAVPFKDYPNFDPLNMPYISEEVRDYPLPYSNLGVPGIIVEDVLIGKTKLHSKSHSGMLNIILRNPLPPPYGELSPYEQAKLFTPSLLVCWIGMYDVLGYAQFNGSGQALPAPTSKDDFAKNYAALMDSLLSLKAALVVGNIPDILDMPYFNIVPNVVIDSTTNAPYLDNEGNPVQLLGVNTGDKVLFPAKFAERQGYGIPSGILNGNGKNIQDDMVLDQSEIEIIESAVSDYNAIIDSVCNNHNIPVVDMYSFFKQVKEGISVAGTTFSDAFISGGFYSLDGIHPSDLGNALIANQWIDVINHNYHANTPAVNLVDIMDDLQSQISDTTWAAQH